MAEVEMTLSRERMRYLPQLSLAERDRRWQAVREKMYLHGIDCLLVVGNDISSGSGLANFRYLTHVGSKSGGYAVFPIEGDPIVFTGPPHLNRPQSVYLSTQNWVTSVRSKSGMAPVAQTLKDGGYEHSTIGVVSYRSPFVALGSVLHGDYLRLEQELPRAKLVDATALVEEVRIIKSPEEIAMLERAAAINRLTINTLIESARPGIKECELFADMLHTQISNGGEPLIFNLFISDPVGSPDGGLAHLLHGVDCPAVPSTRPLQLGDLVITEFHSSYGGYLAPTEFSLFVGEAPKELRRIHDVAVECLKHGVAQMTPGSTLREVWEAFRRPCEEAGMDHIELGFHGHGLASPEFPTCTVKPGGGILDGSNLSDFRLSENMIFGTNIDIHDPNWRTDVGIMLGDMIHITGDGPRRMVDIPLEFPQVGV